MKIHDLNSHLCRHFVNFMTLITSWFVTVSQLQQHYITTVYHFLQRKGWEAGRQPSAGKSSNVCDKELWIYSHQNCSESSRGSLLVVGEGVKKGDLWPNAASTQMKTCSTPAGSSSLGCMMLSRNIQWTQEASLMKYPSTCIHSFYLFWLKIAMHTTTQYFSAPSAWNWVQ